jgi:germination protein M
VTPAWRTTRAVALLIALALAAAACASSSGPLGTPASPVVSADTSGAPAPSDAAPESPSPAPTPSVEPSSSTVPGGESASPAVSLTPAPSPVATTLVRAYFMLGSFTDNAGLVPVLRRVPDTRALARAALTALFEGPIGAEVDTSPAMYTSIPAGVTILDLSISGGVATVILSREWTGATTSFTEGSATAQVVYTLTQFSTVDKVKLEVDGQADGPTLRRSDFQQLGLLPAIFVDRPAWGAAAGNPMRLTGLANVFEAQFMVQLLDGKGKVLVEQPVMASCGTGCWGSFKTDVGYQIGKAQYGTLRVFEPSAKDGSPVNVTEYRVWLTP